MNAKPKPDLVPHVPPPKADIASLGDDLIWGVAEIARAINRSPRQAFHLLEKDRLPARKVGGRWCASRARLRSFFAELLAGEVA